MVSQFGSMFTIETVQDFVDLTYICVSVFVGCCKLSNVVFYRKDIIDLMNIFMEDPCACSNKEEDQVQARYDDQLRKNAVRYTMVVEMSVASTILNSLVTNFQHGRLTYRGWFPYDYTTAVLFPLTYALQLLCVLVYSWIHVSVDILFFGLLMQLCCQFDILFSRFSSITSENKGVLRRCIRHHDRIYRLAEIMNDSLQLTMFAQFFGSFMVICLSLIQLLNADILSTEFLATIFYLSSILLQSFLYCWYGNEVRTKSVDLADVMFHVDWTGLSEKGRKIILFAMTRTRSPILFESVHVITVNIDFFVVSYESELCKIKFDRVPRETVQLEGSDMFEWSRLAITLECVIDG
ncbi:Putative odorant receptor 9a [Habropoda laboriosa]|uniref:Odorant receptor n=1 Tax=Habropoda laboriosa TaxID=597456 RepID=A0A0L7R6T1_9HYME|nr:Putative odorant receptor 9a [Habropoda laboriosa]